MDRRRSRPFLFRRMKAAIVIPARFASTRFPGKPLVLIRNKPLVQWVWERAMRCRRAGRVVVATDDERIYRAVEFFGGEAVMTSPDHPSGTDRIAEVARKVKAALYVNLQGDEPLIDPAEIDRLIDGLVRSRADLATLAHPIEDSADLANPNVVKVVTDARGRALYFSRSPIPYWRDGQGKTPAELKKLKQKGRKGQKDPAAPPYWRHVGIYAYRAAALKRFVGFPPSPLERAESLEQLRALENGLLLQVIPTKMRCQGVDTPADLAAVTRLLKKT